MLRAMYGTSGDWVYVLEDWSMATHAAGVVSPCIGEVGEAAVVEPFRPVIFPRS